MAEFLAKNDKRTKYCGEFTKEDIGKEAVVMGWVQRQRDLGSLIFIDLRDRTGIVQLAFDENTDKTVFDKAFQTRSEYVLCVHGIVRSRGEGAINKNIPTGEIEIAVSSFKILGTAETPPFEIVENSDVRTDVRMKYRYLDLRRPDVHHNMLMRSRIAKITRDFYAENGFIEIETPNLVKPTPEGARDYLVPSRVHNGKFYALPQSPQIYKQLLMLSGFDRYIQIARCFRDEDLRADRQPEFTQVDLEMSFVSEDDIMTLNEKFVQHLFREVKGIEIELPLQRMKYEEAMRRFGSDKPDLRFEMEIVDLSVILKECGFKVFSGAIANGGIVRAINVKGGAKFSRKEIDALAKFAASYKAKGVAWYKSSDGEISSSYAKFLSDTENEAIKEAVFFEDGDLILIVADREKIVCDTLGALRCHMAKKLGLVKKDEYRMLWVTDFPLFEYDEESGALYAAHNPFTMPVVEDIKYLDTEPLKVNSTAFDIVINGMEAGGGSMRINHPELQEKILGIIGIPKEIARTKFGFLMDAYKYGAPPHGGMAFGFDRLITLLLELDDIRDVIAFPKMQNASEPMSDSPGITDSQSLADLGISIIHSEEDSVK
ncbi:MAG: aspartate--tRNA ligase [Clostridiales bacterium]|nr:aspartate--tRNA ligase [Clostridiales bacterium]